ncbi:putative O-sialoglycoprotein endopeptidase [Talaromyces proteolyticus]|uniref:O-sialoglycoprotein endopeptidase n=1 Tax=Talaromyces proteolyticus TaxID=1131652 RepID=A0AAD4KTW8_9EURO|nr:putative O-sialoglycoprotein endopeptidase [Talaromyces proteolyticus]KAH8700783.1 putative O-sialoglycoprotein endopeptidase [Talaromyces proteolyticus]
MLILHHAQITTRFHLPAAAHAGARHLAFRWRRSLLTLAIESSCDDTSVAIVEKHTSLASSPAAKVYFLENITADTRQYRGIHPIEALQSHQENLGKLVQKALQFLPVAGEGGSTSGYVTNAAVTLSADGVRRRLPDFVAATRGPGMRSNLSVGLDTAKGLAVAWQKPLVGVHHMQAHLLTPRLVSGLNNDKNNNNTTDPLKFKLQPEFPFLSILASGGHSMLVHSKSLLEHEVLATTADIAIGETLDKSSRHILPESILQSSKTTMYGKLLERFAFPRGASDYADYRPPMTRGEETVKHEGGVWGWSITTPFANTRDLKFSFSCVASTVDRIARKNQSAGREMGGDERIALAREAMRICFEHLASRTIIGLEMLEARRRQAGGEGEAVKTLVVSGGVAANQFLMKVLRSFLDVRGFENVEIVAPPPYLCTDNAAMIGWAGLEMFEAGWVTDLSVRALRKWTLDPQASDGGILGPGGWTERGWTERGTT